MPYRLDDKYAILSHDFPHTKRWTPIIERKGPGLTGERLRFYYSTAFEQILPNGRQALKTELTRRKIVQHLPIPKPWDDPRYFMTAPTREQVKRINWDKFKKLVPKHWIRRIYETDLCIKTVFGSELWLIGLDKPQRIEGDSWDGGACDEFCDTRPKALDQHIRPALAARDGWLIILGVPDFGGCNAEDYKKLCDKIVLEITQIPEDERDNDIFIWGSSDVLTERAERRLREKMSALVAEQELGGNVWTSAPGLAYPLFDEAIHVAKSVPLVLDGITPILITCDFNFGYHNWLICQYINGVYHICRQVFLRDSYVGGMINECKEILSDAPSEYFSHERLILFAGDYSGDAKKADSPKSVWLQIKEKFPNATYIYKPQGPITTRLENVNKNLKSGTGESHTLIDPRCTELIDDFKFVPRKALFAPSGKSGSRTHASDAYGYLILQYEKRLKMMNLTIQDLQSISG